MKPFYLYNEKYYIDFTYVTEKQALRAILFCFVLISKYGIRFNSFIQQHTVHPSFHNILSIHHFGVNMSLCVYLCVFVQFFWWF